MHRYIFNIIFFLVIVSPGFSADSYLVSDIYTIEDDSSYSLILDHNHVNIDYMVQEIFDPPTVIIEIKNIIWNRGNFTRKSAHSPLYQFDVRVQYPKSQSKQDPTGIRVRMSFNNIPRYTVSESSVGDNKNLFRLTGISKMRDGYKAFINNEILMEGDRIRGFMVQIITEKKVVLKKNNSSVTLRL